MSGLSTGESGTATWPTGHGSYDRSCTVTVDGLAAELTELEDKSGYDIDAALDRALVIERQAVQLGAFDLVMRARLVQADVWERRGDLAHAAKMMWQVNQWAVDHDSSSVRARSHLLLARAHRSLGDIAAALDHMVCALEHLDESEPAEVKATYLVKLADVLNQAGNLQAAAERYQQAERLAISTGDPERHIVVLNNYAYSNYVSGEPQQAWNIAEAMIAVSEAQGRQLDAAELDTVARIQIELGEYGEAERYAQESLRVYSQQENVKASDIYVEILLTLAVAQRHLGVLDTAQESLNRCRLACEESGHAAVGVRVLQEQAELHAATGDYRGAFESYKAFHIGDKALVSAHREAQAHNREAMLEVTQARKEAARFREQAHRDPLTGLANRRFVDERLPGLIAGSDRTPLTIALVDLDHFKRINDNRSHEAGDAVLVVIARMLEDAAQQAENGFAARMGGEEFLVVLAGVEPAESVEQLQKLRRCIADHDWSAMAGELPVTVSIGVTTALPHNSQAELIARADEMLYVAKKSGRNRLDLAPAVPLEGRRRHRDGRRP